MYALVDHAGDDHGHQKIEAGFQTLEQRRQNCFDLVIVYIR